MNIHQEKIYKYLIDSISSGRIREDGRIPTEKELGEMFGTSRLNAHYAVKNLENFGILRRNKKEGTFVKNIPSAFMLGELSSLTCSRLCVLNHCSPAISHIHWNERIFKSLELNLNAKGIEVTYRNIHDLEKVGDYRKILSELVKEGCNALLLVADDKVDSMVLRHPELLFEFHRNVFIFDRGHGGEWNDCPYNVISINSFGEGVMAAEHLAECGYEKILFCRRGDVKKNWADMRFKGLLSGFKRSGTVLTLEDVSVSESVFPECKEFVEKLRRYSAVAKTAVVPVNDEFASILIDAAAGEGLKTPENFGIVSFDDNSAFRKYNLTTVSPSLEKIGDKLSFMIISTINGDNSGETLFVKIDSTLIKRNTTL